jgi:glycosyltransferase involved in cell wall biosynthesis
VNFHVGQKTFIKMNRKSGRVEVYSMETGEPMYDLNIKVPGVESPSIDCICVTNRPKFGSPALKQFLAQRWPNKRLLVVDAGLTPSVLKDAANEYVQVPPESTVGSMRNVGLEMASSNFVFWWDDDDWRHPTILSSLASESRADPFVALSSTYWVDLSGVISLRGSGQWPVFASGLYHRSGLPQFRTEPLRKTDTYWIHRVKDRGRIKVHSDWSSAYVIVCHGRNVHNPLLRSNPIEMTEEDPVFLPDDPNGLRTHLERIREAVRD